MSINTGHGNLAPPRRRVRPNGPRLMGFMNAAVASWESMSRRRQFLSTPAELLELAARRIGLRDFGDARLAEPLEMLCATLRDSPQLTAAGRIVLRADLLQRLCNRLEIEYEGKLFPELASAPVRQPWFVLGWPRSGTTLLHRLLALDPAHRAPLTWEIYRPCPSPDPAMAHADFRIKQAERGVRLFHYFGPDYRTIHEVGASLPEECLGLVANSLVSDWFHAGCRADEYMQWYFAQDLTATYALHRQQLRILQRKWPRRRWVLKAPTHLHGLPWLLRIYPDARIIQTHRDPAEALPSLASLFAVVRGMNCREIDPVEVAREMCELMSRMLLDCMKARDAETRRRDSRARFADVYYSDLAADPIATVETLYRSLGEELGAEARTAMQRYLSEQPRHKHGVHRYDRAQFGIDVPRERERLKFYYERFEPAAGSTRPAWMADRDHRST